MMMIMRISHYDCFCRATAKKILLATTRTRRLLSTSTPTTTTTTSSSSSSSFWRFQQRIPLSKPCRVLLAGPHFQGGYHFLQQTLAEHGSLRKNEMDFVLAPTPASVADLAPTVQVAIPFMEKFDSSFFGAATRLQLCIQFGVGLEGVDMEAATKAGVVVSNVPAHLTGNAQATSEHAIWLTLSLLRNRNNCLQERFQQQILGGLPIPQSLFQKNVTVVGYGNVGRVLCRYFQTMGANVTAVRRNWNTKNDDTNSSTTVDNTTNISNPIIQATSLEEILPTTQILVLACTMTPDTLHLINEKTISLLPQNGESIIVNVGRGPLVEYNAILQALESGKTAGFASDVGVGASAVNKPSEPWDPTDRLSQHPNVLFTPHVGGYTDYSYQEMAHRILTAIHRVVFQQQPPPVWVNQQ